MRVCVKFKCYNASGINSSIIYGCPGPSTFLHFAHALAARSGLSANLKEGIIPFIYKFEPVGRQNQYGDFIFDNIRSTARSGRFKGKKNTKMNSKDQYFGQNRTDTPKINLAGGVVFTINEMDLDSETIIKKLKSALPDMRFGGGVLLPVSTQKAPGGVTELPPGNPEKLKQSIKGSVIPLETRLSDPAPGKDMLDVLIDTVTLKNVETKQGHGWVRPCLLGYRFLTTPRENIFARKITPKDKHVYAEPLVGAVTWVSSWRLNTERSLWYLHMSEDRIRYTTDKHLF